MLGCVSDVRVVVQNVENMFYVNITVVQEYNYSMEQSQSYEEVRSWFDLANISIRHVFITIPHRVLLYTSAINLRLKLNGITDG